MSLRLNRRFIAAMSMALLLFFLRADRLSAQQQLASDVAVSLKSAVCPIVYPNDETPGAKGIRYTFFGNAFFINSQGYLVTAAHVLQTFRDLGQPYILVDRPNAPPQLLKASIIATDWTHDVAVLRASPNPFESNSRVAFLPLAISRPAPGDAILATALHPANIRTATSYKLPVQDFSAAQVLAFVQTREEINLPQTDLFVFSHEVEKGQSGSPVLLANSREVVGLVDGRWLRPSSFSLSAVNGGHATPYSGPIGAAVPIDYLLDLLRKNSISFSATDSHQVKAGSLK